MFNWITRHFGSKTSATSKHTSAPQSSLAGTQITPRQQAEALKRQGNHYFSSGDLVNAAQFYRQSITADPGYAESYNNLAMILHRQAQLSEAQQLLQQALQLDPGLTNAHFNLGLIFKDLQLLPEAISHWKTVLEQTPDDETGLFSLAQLYSETGEHEAARSLLNQALLKKSGSAQIYLYLGHVEKAAGNFESAISNYRQALQYAPADKNILYHLGLSLQQQDLTDEAISCFQQSASADALFQLALIFIGRNMLNAAQDNLKRVIELRLNDVNALFLLGKISREQGNLSQAQNYLRQVISLAPNMAEALMELAETCKAQNRLTEAINYFSQVVTLQPENSVAHGCLGLLFWQLGRMDESIASSRRAVQLDPNFASAYCNLGLALKDQGQPAEGAAAFRKAIALRPDMLGWYSNILLSLQYVANLDPMEVFQEHVRFGELLEAKLKPDWQPHLNQKDPERRLKIGYVSGDFRNHSVAFFVEPIFANHDKSQFELYAYYSHRQHDKYTDQIAASFDHWIACAELSDDELASRIRADQIDILIDLSGHTAFNRLPVFARKPAPLQATWLGYQATTGLTAMDYRITDTSMDPVGTTEQFHTETLIRIPSSGQFQPATNSPAVNALPALSGHKFTFGCLNNLAKINQEVINVWARILHALPEAQFMLGNISGDATKDSLSAMFLQEGITAERLIFKPKVSFPEYLALHLEIDLALDTFPYNGGTTTFHSLWMGVPVVALAGNTPVSRAGVSILAGAGLPEFAANNKEEYVACAVKFAQDLPRLNQIRLSLRQQMTPLFGTDPVYLTRPLEDMYRSIWTQWCTIKS